MRRPEVPDFSRWTSWALVIGVVGMLFGLLLMHQLPHDPAQGSHAALQGTLQGVAPAALDGHEDTSHRHPDQPGAAGASSLLTNALVIAGGGSRCEGDCPPETSVLHLCLAVLVAAAGLVLAARTLLVRWWRSHPARPSFGSRGGSRAERTPPWAVPALSELCLLRI